MTRSDLLKLPVRIFIFTLITHLEALMADVIKALCAEDSGWLQYLSEGRREKANCKYNELKRSRLDLSLLECTDYCDKRRIIRKLCGFTTAFETEVESIEKLRDSVAHAGNYLDSEESLHDLVRNIDRAEYWIRTLWTFLPSE